MWASVGLTRIMLRNLVSPESLATHHGVLQDIDNLSKDIVGKQGVVSVKECLVHLNGNFVNVPLLRPFSIISRSLIKFLAKNTINDRRLRKNLKTLYTFTGNLPSCRKTVVRGANRPYIGDKHSPRNK
jgi:hypothetical protein